MAVRNRGNNVQNFNYHTHTSRCGHAVGTDREYVKAAIKQGYKVLGFSDHAPYRNIPSPRIRMDWDMQDDYINSVKELKREYEGIIDIHLGMETEFYPEYLDEKKELHDKVEYLLLGQHFIKPTGEGTFFRQNTDDQIMEYAERIVQALDTGLFTYLCHPDLYMVKQTEFNETCEKAAHIICKKAAETNTPLEINVHGAIRGKYPFPSGEQYFYPNKQFWTIASQYDTRCLLGIDAHDPQHLLDSKIISDCLEELADLNLNFIKEPII